MVIGLATKLGVITANSGVCLSTWFAKASANALPTAPSLSPIRRSIWDTSAPSPTNASPASYMIKHFDS